MKFKNQAAKLWTRELVLQITLLIGGVAGYKIAITTPQTGSHVMGKINIGKALVEKGHEVYLIVADRYPKIDSIVKAGIKPLTYKVPPNAIIFDSDEVTRRLAENIFNGLDARAIDAIHSNAFHEECKYLLNSTAAIEEIQRHNFDLFIVEPFIISPCNTITPILAGKPFVSVTQFYFHWQIRVPVLPSYFSVLSAPVTVDTVKGYTMGAKLKTLLWYIVGLNPQILMPGQSPELLQKYAPQYRTWDEIMRKSEFFFCEMDHHLDGFAPAFPNFLSIAGMSARSAKPLPTELEQIMTDSGRHGVIILTFGASAYYMPQEVVKKFLDAFSQVNQTVLARFNVPDGVSVPKNVKIVKWMPQNDLLGHPATKLFITHCGNNGQYEALYHAVPMLGFPQYAEQHNNNIRMFDKGFGLPMSILDFTAEELISNINEVIYNRKYKDNIVRASEIWRDELNREKPLDRATFWIEHVIKYGGRHLRSPSMELSLFEFLMLDVVLVLLISFIATVIVIALTVKCLFRKCYSARSYKEKIS